MAHELRNPLAAVLSGLQALDRGPQEDSAQEIRAVMHREISHITRLISDLLDTSRLDTGTLRYQITEHLLSESIDLAIDLNRHCFSNSGQQLHTKIEASDVVIQGDTSRIAQAVSNLLHNASKFSPPDCTITLATRSNEGLVEIDVIDHGGGISSLEQAQLFRRYTPGSGGRNILSPCCNSGLGLGLYLSREIIRCHGGDIALVSSSSAGSLFRISLPIHQQRPYGQLPPSKMEAAQTSSIPVSILAVDDNAAALELLRLLLELEGHTVYTASNACDGERLFAQMRPDVVLLDIGLPDLNGRDLAKKLRKHEHGKKSLIIALTGWGTEQDELLSREAGCDAHITKPANIDQLCSLFTPRKTEAA
jgi:CheY-like chemotaxis protein